jgi:hypothetical protein
MWLKETLVEHLASKHEVLISNPSATKKKKKKNNKKKNLHKNRAGGVVQGEFKPQYHKK